ncbi:hypothetical protein QUB32_21685 [Microcoleus sp. AT8-A4]
MNEEAIVQIVDETNELWFSVASIWEIGIKVAIEIQHIPCIYGTHNLVVGKVRRHQSIYKFHLTSHSDAPYRNLSF